MPTEPTLGGEAARLMQTLGCTLMPWQRRILDVALELDPATGLLVRRPVRLCVPHRRAHGVRL